MSRDREAVARELLAVRCRRGDRAALDELVRTYEARLLYFIRRLGADEDDAWDVLQKAWVRALGGIGRLDDPRSLVLWFYRVARNAAVAMPETVTRRTSRCSTCRVSNRRGSTTPIPSTTPCSSCPGRTTRC